MSAKHAGKATLSVAGTMVWSQRIVMPPLQMGGWTLGSEEMSLSSWSGQRLACLTTKQAQCQSRTTRGGMEKGWQGGDAATVWGVLTDDHSASPHRMS
jgi:hypothetical protein